MTGDANTSKGGDKGYVGTSTTPEVGGGGGGAWAQNLPLKFVSEPQILPSKI